MADRSKKVNRKTGKTAAAASKRRERHRLRSHSMDYVILFFIDEKVRLSGSLRFFFRYEFVSFTLDIRARFKHRNRF